MILRHLAFSSRGCRKRKRRWLQMQNMVGRRSVQELGKVTKEVREVFLASRKARREATHRFGLNGPSPHIMDRLVPFNPLHVTDKAESFNPLHLMKQPVSLDRGLILLLLRAFLSIIIPYRNQQRILPGIPILEVDGKTNIAPAQKRFFHDSKSMLLQGYQKVRH